MNTALWIAQGFVALIVTLTGTAKLVLAREQLARKMHWAAEWPRETIVGLLAAGKTAADILAAYPSRT